MVGSSDSSGSPHNETTKETSSTETEEPPLSATISHSEVCFLYEKSVKSPPPVPERHSMKNRKDSSHTRSPAKMTSRTVNGRRRVSDSSKG